MSVIALILPFSQRFNLFMLLPNLYWAKMCILYVIRFLFQWFGKHEALTLAAALEQME